MTDLPTRYYVQRAQTNSIYGRPGGWETVILTFDPVEAKQYAHSFERAVLFEEGENVSELVSTVARIMTADELRADGGAEAVAAAEAATRIQYEKKLAEWKRSR
jgi:hypothetical protein